MSEAPSLEELLSMKFPDLSPELEKKISAELEKTVFDFFKTRMGQKNTKPLRDELFKVISKKIFEFLPDDPEKVKVLGAEPKNT